MNCVLEEILKSGYVKSVDGKLVKLHSNISSEEGKLLQEIIYELKPKVSLEVGLAYGISALFICEALKNTPNSRHIIIDPMQSTHWQGIGLNNLKKVGYEEIIEFHQQPSHLALSQLEAQGIKIDFAFIDGMHTFDHTLIDFFYVDKLLNVGGVVAIDDTSFPSIHKVCRFIVTNRAYSIYRYFNRIDYKPSLGRRALERLAHIYEPMRRILKPEYVQPDFELGFAPRSELIAFKKEAEDTRKWNFYREF
ncbi:class I SAM-dependent methyltransferase [Argonema antarcticum]|uniref:class I SAM-dependent methyltransferase n=1 Tax=Argonema antarcticum TaxID=2942763 RepID=UPI0020114456|nr:class I SAM-dependent methyltransferase [Argonema antarcticum]MCL1471486.1 class I SAM-dependent methyltransferase [Argonema antarcticum A004/B2]